MWEIIKSRILYAGIKKDEFNALKEDFFADNKKNLAGYTIIVTLFFAVLGIIVSLSSGIFQTNGLTYSLTAAVMAVIFVLLRIFRKKTKYQVLLIRILMYLFMAVLYVESMAVTFKHTDFPAVTFIGIMLVLPLLFIDCPLIIMIVQTCCVIVFSILDARIKEPGVSYTDIYNAFTFLIASFAEILVVIPVRVGALQKSKAIEFLSRNDLLTDVQNRNSFEEKLKEMADSPEDSLICIYADVNGLHEVNNEFGHEAGDNMLKLVAGETKKMFGGEETYRVGGDEFVVLSLNRDREQIEEHLKTLDEIFCRNNYHVSFGYAAAEDYDCNVHETIKAAEQMMYRTKEQYYMECGKDRRAR